MLIDFSPDGRVQFTRSPALLALFPDERKRVVRMTDIRFDEPLQMYGIVFLTGAFADRPLTSRDPEMRWGEFLEDHQGCYSGCHPLVVYAADGRIMCREYEDAVKIEVEYIDFLREQGIAVG